MRTNNLFRISTLIVVLALLMFPGTALLAADKPAIGMVDLNSADAKTLEALPGVGMATAKAIIAARPFKSVDDLKNVKGIGDVKFAALKDKVTVGAAPVAAAAPAAPAAPAKPAVAAAPAAKPSAPDSKATKPVEPPASASAQTPPVKGMVWVNTSSKVFHREGDKWYGNTKQGKFMTEDDAVKAGFHESKEKQKK